MKLLPSLKQLEYLVALNETEHFGKASERCFVTPSTLSAGIRDLEGVLGVALAERTKRHVKMTAIGSQIAQCAHKLLRDAEDIMSLAQTSQSPMTGELRLGVIPTIAPFFLPQVLPELNARFPDLNIYLEEGLTDPILDHLRNGGIDAALIALPYFIEGLEHSVLFDDEFVFACHPSHPLSKAKVISTSDLTKHQLMLLEEGHCLRTHALEACRLEQGQGRYNLEASSFHTMVQMVASGLGATLLPKLAIGAGITSGTGIQLIPLKRGYKRRIALVWRRSSVRIQDIETFRESLSSLAGKFDS